MSEEQEIPLTRKIVHFLARDDVTCQVIFVTKKKVDEELEVELQYMDLTDDSIVEIKSNCQKFVNDKEDWEYEEYGKKLDEELRHKKYNIEVIANVPNTNKYLKKADFKAESLADTELVNNLKFIQFRFESRGKIVIFVRKFTPQRILSHGKKIFKEISGTLKITDDKLLEIPEDHDFCKYGNDLLIFHTANFEDFFDYHEIHEKFYKTVFNHIEKKVDYTIEDFDTYKQQAFDHPQKLRKLPAIEEKKMYLWTFKEIKEFLKIRPVPTIELDEKNKKIKFKNAYAMMDFYNDAHLTSQATNNKYLAQSKSKE
jgi:hypothetical protein